MHYHINTVRHGKAFVVSKKQKGTGMGRVERWKCQVERNRREMERVREDGKGYKTV